MTDAAPSDEWAPFADMMESGDLPTAGFRVLLRLGDDGRLALDYGHTGEQLPAYLMLGALIGAAVEEFHRHVHEHDEESA